MRILTSICFLFFVACGPYMKAAKSVDEKNIRPSLLASASIDALADRDRTDENGRSTHNLETTARYLSNNLELEPFGERMIATVSEYLKRHGFQVVKNKEQAQQLMSFNDDIKRMGAVVGGIWISKDTSTYTLTNNTLLLRSQRDTIVEKLNGPVENEAFLFLHAEIRDQAQWLLFSRPECTLHIRVLDESGNDLMRSISYGYGESSVLFVNRSAENLEKALVEALRQLDSLERQDL